MVFAMDLDNLRASIARQWDEHVVPSLLEFVAIPAVSPAYDPEWAQHGHLTAAVEHVRSWAEHLGLAGATTEVVTLDDRGPLLMVDIPGTAGSESKGTVLLYGHLDKQPAQGEWSAGLGPWQGVVRGDRLYGRGAVDDGYSGYAALTAVSALRQHGGEHARAVVLLETGEESGSPDLPAYLEHLDARLGDVTLVIGLDSVGADNERLWLTTNLRGAVVATLTVRVLNTPVHSGLASGIVADPVRVLRTLLDRIENSATGEVRLPEMTAPIPEVRRAEAAELAALHPDVARLLPLSGSTRAVADDDTELLLNNTWRPALTVVGLSGLAAATGAPMVLSDAVSVRLSFRTPPTVSAEAACAALVTALSTDVPYGADVQVNDFMLIDGWNEPERAPWLQAALDDVSKSAFGSAPGAIGIGGGIPFIGMLGRRYPQAQFVVTGAASSDSNMHVPDEWLSLPMAQRVTEAIAGLLDAHARRP